MQHNFSNFSNFGDQFTPFNFRSPLFSVPNSLPLIFAPPLNSVLNSLPLILAPWDCALTYIITVRITDHGSRITDHGGLFTNLLRLSNLFLKFLGLRQYNQILLSCWLIYFYKSSRAAGFRPCLYKRVKE